MSAKIHIKMLLLLGLCLVGSQALPRYSITSYNNLDLSGAASFNSYAYAPRPQQPMQLTGNYNLIMPDYYDHHPAESVQLQNFASFHDAQIGTGSADLGMDESQHQFLRSSTPLRAPQPLSADERRIRQQPEPLVPLREKKFVLGLKKGNTKPRGAGYQQWDQFDYDLYSVNPGESKKYNYDG